LLLGLIVSFSMYTKEREARRRAVAAEEEQQRMRLEAEAGAKLGAKLTQAGILMSRQQFDEAEQAMNDVPPHPANAAIYDVLGIIHAQRGERAAAIRNFARTLEVSPSDHDAIHSLAPLLAQESDPDAYRRLREKILRQFGDTRDPIIAERMAKDSLLLPPLGTEMEMISRMVNTAIAAGPEHRFWDYFQFVKGLAEYREGQFSSAEEWMQKVIPHENDPNRTVSAYMVLAMAQRRLLRVDEARATLARGIRKAEETIPQIEGPQWNDQLIARLLMAEAKGLIDAASDGPAKQAKP
jgi:tetratricopeptide (TPR) repeat protein